MSAPSWRRPGIIRIKPGPTACLGPIGMEVVLAADCNYETKLVEALLATIGALVAPRGVLVLASREQRNGLSECLERLEAEFACEASVVFDEDAAAWHHEPARSAAEVARHANVI